MERRQRRGVGAGGGVAGPGRRRPAAGCGIGPVFPGVRLPLAYGVGQAMA